MTTVLAVYNSEGCVGRCDAKCHKAINHHCDCICGGRNHGGGEQQAIENTAEMFEAWIEDYRLKVDFTEVEVPALYTSKTRTALTIARIINAAHGAKSVVKDIRREKATKETGGHWSVEFTDGRVERFRHLPAVRSQYALQSVQS